MWCSSREMREAWCYEGFGGTGAERVLDRGEALAGGIPVLRTGSVLESIGEGASESVDARRRAEGVESRWDRRPEAGRVGWFLFYFYFGEEGREIALKGNFLLERERTIFYVRFVGTRLAFAFGFRLVEVKGNGGRKKERRLIRGQ